MQQRTWQASSRRLKYQWPLVHALHATTSPRTHIGINRVDDASQPKGYRIVGDVAYGPVSEVAGAITPVPGGVGRMTIAMLLQNTLQAFVQAGGQS